MIDRSAPQPFNTSCGSLCRSPLHYVQVVRQFDVESNPRYQAGGGDTWCNLFAWDVTRAFACELPHWVPRTDGVYGMREQTINEGIAWLGGEGFVYGWENCSEDEAQLHAAGGLPTLATYYNPAGHGHVAVVMPSQPGALLIAQAGRSNLFNAPLAQGFGSLPVSFWFHL